MFRRKKGEGDDDHDLPELPDELGIPVKPGSRPTGVPMTNRPASPPPLAATPLGAAPRPTESPRGPVPAASPLTVTPPAAPARDLESRKLIVGREISLSGEITSCDRLVVEGSVEANLLNCRDIDIAETGLFKGSASIEDAEIRGRFEGTLEVRRRLLIRSTGRVTGTVRYGQIEIECGGQISGEIKAQPEEKADAPVLLAMPKAG
jgi:cytoskeletal protein CcmA (bactofilin family)